MVDKLVYTDAEIESDRLDALNDADPEENYSPGSYYCHEALHMASYLQRQVALELMEHPSIAEDREWFRLAHEASNALWALYQSIGDKHLRREPVDKAD